MKHGLRKYYEDNLVVAFTDDKGENFRQGKRVGAWCKLTKEERKAHVASGIVALTKTIKDGRKCSMSRAFDLAQEAVGERKFYHLT